MQIWSIALGQKLIGMVCTEWKLVVSNAPVHLQLWSFASHLGLCKQGSADVMKANLVSRAYLICTGTPWEHRIQKMEFLHAIQAQLEQLQKN